MRKLIFDYINYINQLLEGLNDILKNRVEFYRVHFMNPGNISNEDIIVDQDAFLKNRLEKFINKK